MAFPKFQTKEVLNKVLNSGEDALNVDLSDSVTVTVDSEFPAAAAITDNFANPTTTSAMSMLMGYDGSTWDRVTIGGGAEAAALRVTIASDSTGVVTVDDGGGALTVDGTVTANLSATDNAVLDAMVVDLAAMETLLTAANVDHAANEALLITIDEDTNAIKGHVDGIETLITSTNSKIDTFDAVLDNILTKNTEIDAVLDTIKTDTQEIEEAVETIEGAVSGGQMQVDIVADGAGLATDANLALMLYGTALVVTAVHAGSDHVLGATYEAFYIGVGGDVSLDCVTSGTNIVFKNLASGQMLPVRATVVNATNTTATNIVALKA